MHNGFLDNNRRHLNLRRQQVGNVLPEHFANSYPKFIQLLEKYYEWQDDNNPTELLNHLFATRDVTETDITLLSYIEDEYLLGDAYFEGFGDTDAEKRATANFSSYLFRAKGTKYAIEWFFRSFYGLDADVRYPKEDIFKIGERSSQIGGDSQKFITNDELYQTFALLVKVGVPLSKWKDIFKLFSHPAGMYLGGEVSINDAVTQALSTEDDIATVRGSSNYSFYGYTTPSDEGTEITFNVNGVGLPGNRGGLFYHINHITTSDSDFEKAYSLDSQGYIDLAPGDSEVAVGSFSIKPVFDSDEAEGTESFRVLITDNIGSTIDAIDISLNDVESQYTLTPLSSSFGENENMVFNVSGTQLPSNGNTLMFYYVDHITTTDSDFLVPPPSESSPQGFGIYNSVGSFSMRPRIDNQSDGGEQFKVIIETPDGIGKDSATITLTNSTPAFAVQVDDIFEGQRLLAQITCDSQDVGNEIAWRITGTAASDPRLFIDSGSHTIAGISDIFSIPFSATDVYTGGVTGTLSLTNSNYTNPLTVSDTFQVNDSAESYVIKMNPAIIAEGSVASFDIETRNVQDATNTYFYIENDETNDKDFLGGRPTSTSRETVTITSNAGSTNNVTFADSDETQDENFIANLYDAPTGGNLLASRQFKILANSYLLTESIDSVDEGNDVEFTFTSGVDGTYYYWYEGDDVNVSDTIYGSIATESNRNTVSVVGGQGTFRFRSKADQTLEGTETFRAFVATTASSGAVAQSNVITINDTSTASAEIVIGAPTAITEGDDFQFLVRVLGADLRVFAEISGAGVTSRFDDTTIQQLCQGNNNTEYTFTTTASPTYDSVQSGLLTISSGNYASLGGATLDTHAFTMSDVNAVYNITANDSVNEGDTLAVSISGTSIPNRTHYYRLAETVLGITDQYAFAGTSIVYLDQTTGITNGMEAYNLDGVSVLGTVTNVTSSSVTMSQTHGEIIAGEHIVFASPQVFDDFDFAPAGSFVVSGNSGSFNLQVAENLDTTNDSYTVEVYDDESSRTPVATSSFTVVDATPAVTVDFTAASGESISNITDTRVGTTSQTSIARIKFTDQGSIEAQGNQEPGNEDTWVEIGFWASDAPSNPGNYTVTGTFITSPSGSGSSSGSFGVAQTLDIDRIYSLAVSAVSVGTSYASTMNISFEVQETANTSNSDTQNVYFGVTATRTGSESGGDTGDGLDPDFDIQ